MSVLYTNNASTTLATGITSSSTSISVSSGKGSLFPAISGSDFFYVTLTNTAGTVEIVKVTARSTDTLTVVRGQDGTTAAAWNAGDKVELRVTKGLLDQLKIDAVNGYASASSLSSHTGNTSNPHSVTASQVGLGNVDNTSDVNKPVSTAQAASIATKVTANSAITAGTGTKITYDTKGLVTSSTTLSASDIPSLDASKITSGTIDSARLPSYVDDVIEATNLASFPTTGETGKIYVALDTNKTYRWSGSAYVYITSGAVDSVAGKTGVVTLVKGDVGLGSVDNTADSAKNVLSATKLTTARTINGVSFDGTANITVADSTKQPVDADLTAIAGLTGTSGLLKKTAADTWTLDTSAYVTSSGVTSVTGTAPIVSSGGTTPAISISAATTSAAGSMSAADKTKLDGVASGATANTGTVTSVSGTGSYGGLTLSGSVTTSGSLTFGGTPTGTWPISVSGSSASCTGNAATATSAGNADTLDGQHGSYYQPASTAITTSNIGSQSVNYATSAGSASSAGNADTLDGYHASSFSLTSHNHNGTYLTSVPAATSSTYGGVKVSLSGTTLTISTT